MYFVANTPSPAFLILDFLTCNILLLQNIFFYLTHRIPFQSMQLPVQQDSVVPRSKMAEKIIFVGATPFWASHGRRSDQRERPIIVRYSTDDSVVQRPRQDRIAEIPPPPSLQRHDRVAKEGPYVVQEDFRQQTMQHVHRYHIDLHGYNIFSYNIYFQKYIFICISFVGFFNRYTGLHHIFSIFRLCSYL